MAYEYLTPFLSLFLIFLLVVGTYCHTVAFRKPRSYAPPDILRWIDRYELGHSCYLPSLVGAVVVALYFGWIILAIVAGYVYWLNR